MRLTIAVSLMLVVLGTVSRGLADESDERGLEDIEAERLFADGRALMARGEHAAACDRFEASRRLSPSATGPLLNLALCKEALGAYATAAVLFEKVIAEDARPSRVSFAERHLRDVRSKQSFLRVVVPAVSPDLRVWLDDAELPSSRFNQEFPLDGGTHVVAATAPGKKEFRQRVELAKEAGHAVMTVVLEDAASTPNPVGYWIGGAGLAAVGVGIVFGIDVALECGGLFTRVCEGPNSAPTNREREAQLREVDTRAWIATIATGIGLAATATGAVVLLTSNRKASATPSVTAGLAPNGPWLHGTF